MDKGALNAMRKIDAQMPIKMDLLSHNFSVECQDQIRKQLILQTKEAPRTGLAKTIQAERVRRFMYEVVLGAKANFLDSARPHYVALKRGRLITAWAKRYYHGRMDKNGKLPGVIFVRPDPYVDKGYMRALRKLNPMLRKFARDVVI